MKVPSVCRRYSPRQVLEVLHWQSDALAAESVLTFLRAANGAASPPR